MIYMEGSNLESDGGISTADLEAIIPSSIDLNNTDILVYTGGTKEWKNDYISNEENAIFILTSSGYKKIETYEKYSMGDPETLTSFMNYSYNNYKADQYYLIIWDHGGALDGAVYDDFVDDNLTISDFKKSLENSAFNKNNKMEAVLFRTCLNGSLEIASIFENYSKYIVFSEEISYGSSYTDVLGFINNLNSESNGVDFGTKFIDRYKEQMNLLSMGQRISYTYSLIDLSKISEVYKNLDIFFANSQVKNNYESISKIRNNIFQYGDDSKIYDTVDLYNLIENLSPIFSKDAKKLLKSIDESVLYNYTNLDTAHGISIYFPYNGNAYRRKYLSVYKESLNFSQNYNTFIKDFYLLQDAATSFSLDLSKNDNVVKNNEVSLKLTDDQLSHFARAKYTVFQRDKEHSNYYKFIYNSNDVDISTDGVITTKIKNNLITIMTDDGKEQYIPIFHDVSDNIESYTSYGALYDNSQDFMSNYYTLYSYLYYSKNPDGSANITNAKVRSNNDERLIGQIVDLKKYNKASIIFSEYKLFDENGNLLDEFESSPVKNGYEFNLNEDILKFSGLVGEDFYVLFNIIDSNNESYDSNLIKVG